MAFEIERKFLVKNDSYQNLGMGIYYHQGYLNASAERVVRVRVIGKKAFLTVKGLVSNVTRLEYEYEIPGADAQEMLEKLCIQPTIEKYRYHIDFEGFVWEVDVFLGENEGLVVAEIELEHEEQHFKKPDWIGEEVTNDRRYYNACLVSHPFKKW